MKKIKLLFELKRNKNFGNRYTIRLGNGTMFIVSQKAEAEEIIRETNKFLSLKWYEINCMITECYEEHRRLTGYLSQNDTGRNPILDTQIRELLTECLANLEWCFNRCYSSNGNYFVFQKFNNTLLNLKKITGFLRSIQESKSNTQAIYELSFILKKIILIENELHSFKQEEATTFFEPWLFEEVTTKELPLLKII